MSLRGLLGCKDDLAIRFTLVMAADLDRHLPVKPFQKIKQLIRCEATEMSVHEMRYVGLSDAKNTGDLALLEPFVFEDLVNVEADLGTRVELVGIIEVQIRKDISGAFLNLN